jgi:HEAT repeat protein
MIIMHTDYTIYLFYLTVGFLCLILVLIVVILCMMIWKRRYASRHKKISAQFAAWLTAIVFEEYDNNTRPVFPIPGHIGKLLAKRNGREVLLSELITLKKNLSGSAGQNLQILYNQLQLEILSLQKLNSPAWHIKARGMQELAIMNQRQHFRTICGYLNNTHPYLRMEAQTALVRFHGFKGLNFLNTTSYLLSEWQQLSLLQLLLHEPATTGINFKRLLRSSNASAIQFALRLIIEQNDTAYYDHVKACLSHSNNAVKKQAVYCMAELATYDTASMLLDECMQYDREVQLTVLEVMAKIGSTAELPFLYKLTLSTDPAIRLACMKAIQAIKQDKTENSQPENIQLLQTA